MLTPAESPSVSEALIERRFYPRVAPAGLITISFGDSNPGMLLNLSENGMLVSTPVALVQNFVCRISLLLDGLANPIEVYARVVWTSEAHRSGIQLLDLCDHDREQLRKWAALETDRASAGVPQQQPRTKIPAQIPAQKKSPKQNVGGNELFSRMPLVASAVAAVVMLAIALMLRGGPIPALFNHSLKPGPEIAMAMKPGGAVASEAPNPQALPPTIFTPIVPQPPTEAPAPPSGSPNAARSASNITNPSEPKDGSTASEDRTVLKPAPTTTRAHSPAAIQTPTPGVGAKSQNLPVRNRSVLQANQHFRDQFIGHIDLAGSGDRTLSPNETLSSVNKEATPLPSPQVNPDSAPLAAGVAQDQPAAAQRASAITGSIALHATPDAQHEVEPNAESTSTKAISGDAAPATASPAANRASKSMGHSLQLTIPAATRALYVNLPGEQVVQSPAVTLHIQRAVLASASSVLPAAPRTETVVVGDLLSHVDPPAPHLTTETGNRVGLRAFLSPDGRVEKLMPVNGSVALVSSAARSIREWRFQPTLLAGQPVPMAVYVLVEFHPEANGSARP